MESQPQNPEFRIINPDMNSSKLEMLNKDLDGSTIIVFLFFPTFFTSFYFFPTFFCKLFIFLIFLLQNAKFIPG